MTMTPYDMLGEEGVRRLAARFYEVMAEEPDAAGIRGMHEADLGPVSEKLAGFLRGWLGGPRDYFEREDAPCIMSVHRRLPIGAAESDQWLACMRKALRDIDASAEVRDLLSPAFERLAAGMRSR